MTTHIQKRVLIVEDEPKLAHLLKDYLHQADFHSHHLTDGAAVLPWVRAEQPDLILLDLMLPNKNGMDICREIRAFSDVPIIITTARVEEIDRLLGLELGADDYICKPYSPREVIARVRAVLRRLDKHTESAANDFVVDIEAYEIRFQGHLLDLTPAEFRLLSTFLQHPGRVYSRAQLLEHLYEDHRVVTDRTVDSHIKNLRRKINTVKADWQGIQSIYGVGYKLEKPIP